MFLGWHEDQITEWRHTRSILSVLSGKDARFIIELPGDFDHVVKPWTKEEKEAYKKRWQT